MKTIKKSLGKVVGKTTYLNPDTRPLRIVRKYVEESHSVSIKGMPEEVIREFSMFLNAEKLNGTFEYNCIRRRVSNEALCASKEIFSLNNDRRRNKILAKKRIREIFDNKPKVLTNIILENFKSKKINKKQKVQLLENLEDNITNSYAKELAFEEKIKSHGARRISDKQYNKYYADLPSVD